MLRQKFDNANTNGTPVSNMDDVFVRKYLKHLRNYLRTIGFDSMRVRAYLQKFKDGMQLNIHRKYTILTDLRDYSD
jgi:hypothetical protein